MERKNGFFSTEGLMTLQLFRLWWEGGDAEEWYWIFGDIEEQIVSNLTTAELIVVTLRVDAVLSGRLKFNDSSFNFSKLWFHMGEGSIDVGEFLGTESNKPAVL